MWSVCLLDLDSVFTPSGDSLFPALDPFISCLSVFCPDRVSDKPQLGFQQLRLSPPCGCVRAPESLPSRQTQADLYQGLNIGTAKNRRKGGKINGGCGGVWGGVDGTAC